MRFPLLAALIFTVHLCRGAGYPDPYWENDLRGFHSFHGGASSDLPPLPPQHDTQQLEHGQGLYYGHHYHPSQAHYYVDPSSMQQVASTFYVPYSNVPYSNEGYSASDHPPLDDRSVGAAKEARTDSKLTSAEKKKVYQIWSRKGLWIGLAARELAACVAELKLEMGVKEKNRSIGVMVQHIMRDNVMATPEYKEDFKWWSRRFTNRARRLEEGYASTVTSPADAFHKLYVNIRNVRTWDDYVTDARVMPHGKNEIESEERHEQRAGEQADLVWNALLQYVIRPMLQHTTIVSNPIVSIETIEEVSRDAHVQLLPYTSKPLTREEIADSLRRYMLTNLQKTPIEVDAFTRARNEWLRQRGTIA